MQEATLEKTSFGEKVGISDNSIETIRELLLTFAADLQALYIKTRGFHWNLEDPRFYFLHGLFEEHYEALEEESDEVAERIRQIGKKAPGSLGEFKRLATIQDASGNLSGDAMIKCLVADYETLIRKMRKAIDQTTTFEDYSTADMFTQILRGFEKRAWMLRSHLTH